MLGGGINNIDIINASQRGARDKLNQMAGIKGSPSGILASSPELMQAVTGAAPAMPVRATGPATPMAPAPMPMAQPVLPQVPAPTAIAAAPVQQPVQQVPAPAPAVPTVPQPASPTTPMKFNVAGPVDVRKTPVAEEASKSFMDYVRGAGDWMAEAIVATYGTGKAAEQAGRGKKAAVDAAVETGDQTNIVNTVLANADVPITDEGKQDFARNVFGMEDVNDIDEINRRIADVAISSAIGESPDKFAQAVLLGLQNYKQTASARAAAVSGAKASTYTPERLFQQAVEKIMGNPEQFDVYNDEGSAVDPMKVRREAMKIAQATSTAMTGGDTFHKVMYDASGKPFYSTDGVNYVDAQGNPYVPPKKE